MIQLALFMMRTCLKNPECPFMAFPSFGVGVKTPEEHHIRHLADPVRVLGLEAAEILLRA